MRIAWARENKGDSTERLPLLVRRFLLTPLLACESAVTSCRSPLKVCSNDLGQQHAREIGWQAILQYNAWGLESAMLKRLSHARRATIVLKRLRGLFRKIGTLGASGERARVTKKSYPTPKTEDNRP